MLKPTRTILALAAGSMVLGLLGAGAAVADDGPVDGAPGAAQVRDDDDGHDEYSEYDDADEYDDSDGDDGYEDGEEGRPGGGDGPVIYPKPKYALGRVVSQGPLKIRSKPTTHSRVLGKVHPHQKLTIVCKKRGEKVDGNSLWYLLERKDDRKQDGDDRMAGMKYDHKRAWVSARWVKDVTPVKWCRS
ncbi:SH3 domain-containing protein [Streptomyces sp. NPDC004126]|uniref:SH3 domain-containing protein n=1 Tax=Streptomyces sp. NPDC004126 TaxID=3390695 RepID=UPI003D05BB24